MCSTSKTNFTDPGSLNGQRNEWLNSREWIIKHPSLCVSAGNVNAEAKFNNVHGMDIYALDLEFSSLSNSAADLTWHLSHTVLVNKCTS